MFTSSSIEYLVFSRVDIEFKNPCILPYDDLFLERICCESDLTGSGLTCVRLYCKCECIFMQTFGLHLCNPVHV